MISIKNNILSEEAIRLSIELCGSIDRAVELMQDKGNKSEYWQGIKDAIHAQNRLIIEERENITERVENGNN